MLNVESLAICAVLLTVLFAYQVKYWKPVLINSHSLIYIITFFMCLLNIGNYLADGMPEFRILNLFVNVLYLSLTIVLSLCMMEYCSHLFPKPFWKNNVQHFLCLLPGLIEIVLVFLSLGTGWVFTVSADGYYVRGKLFFLQFIAYAYLLFTSVMGIYWYCHSETTREKNLYGAIALFAVSPLLIGGIQMIMPANSLSTLEFSILISLLLHYCATQDNRVTRDSLTELPNRIAVDSVLMEMTNDHRRNGNTDLYVLMGDLDHFKTINDTYGHLKGDLALQITGRVLQRASMKIKGIAARFGGDEFLMVMETSERKQVDEIIQMIEDDLAESSKDETFTLRMSIGVTVYDGKKSVTELLEEADQELYRVKEEHRKQTLK